MAYSLRSTAYSLQPFFDNSTMADGCQLSAVSQTEGSCAHTAPRPALPVRPVPDPAFKLARAHSVKSSTSPRAHHAPRLGNRRVKRSPPAPPTRILE
jgi:hypothetical protein